MRMLPFPVLLPVILAPLTFSLRARFLIAKISYQVGIHIAILIYKTDNIYSPFLFSIVVMIRPEPTREIIKSIFSYLLDSFAAQHQSTSNPAEKSPIKTATPADAFAETPHLPPLTFEPMHAPTALQRPRLLYLQHLRMCWTLPLWRLSIIRT